MSSTAAVLSWGLVDAALDDARNALLQALRLGIAAARLPKGRR